MKRIEWFWNLTYYYVFRLDIKFSQLFNYLNPFNLINNIPSVKRYHAKQGVDDMNKLMNEIFDNPKNGISSLRSGSFMGILLVLTGIGLLNFFQVIIGKSLILIAVVFKDSLHFIIYLIILIGPTILINNSLLFRKDKYLNYFKEFEKMTEKKKSNYSWLIFFVVILIISFCIGSFFYLSMKFR